MPSREPLQFLLKIHKHLLFGSGLKLHLSPCDKGRCQYGYAGTGPAVSAATVAILKLSGTPPIAFHHSEALRVCRLAKHRLVAGCSGRDLRHIACYAVVGTRRMSVEHLEAFSAAWRVTVLAISLLAMAHLLGSIGNSGVDSEALAPMLVALVSGGGA
jgi:hypothetical protein